MGAIMLRAGWSLALRKPLLESEETNCSQDYRTLTGVPIAGQILSACNGAYYGLIIFAGLSYALGLVCFVISRILAVGWKINVIY